MFSFVLKGRGTQYIHNSLFGNFLLLLVSFVFLQIHRSYRMQRRAGQSIAILFSKIIICTIKYSTGLRGGRRQLSRFSGAAPQSGRTVHRSDHLSAFNCTTCATCVAVVQRVRCLVVRCVLEQFACDCVYTVHTLSFMLFNNRLL